VRRGTFLLLVMLFVLIVVAAVAQLVIASGDRGPYTGPTSPGQLPTFSPAP
jgi:hypothetical protein